MIQFLLRACSDNGLGKLYVRACNRVTDFRISCDIKLPIKDWSRDAQCLRCFTDTRPRAELRLLSYADISQRMFELKKVLESYSDEDLTRDIVRWKMEEILHEKSAHREGEEDEWRKPTFIEFIRQYAQECSDGTRKCMRGTNNISDATIKGYYVLANKLEAFQKKHHKVVDWDSVTIGWLRLWKKDLAEEYSTNYIAHLISVLKRMLNAGRELNYTTCMDFTMKEFGGVWEEVENVYLTHDMLDELWAVDLSDASAMMERMKKIKCKEDQARAALIIVSNYLNSLEAAKHLFLVGCMTGQRISDYKRINMGLVTTLRDGRQYIEIEQQKTKKRVFIPVDPRVQEILDMYNGNLPKLSDQKLNDKLKEIGLLMGWTHTTNIRDRKKNTCKKFYECLCTHTARRTFATLAYEDGVPTRAIMSITGHSSEDTFRKYIKTSEQDRAILAAEEFMKYRSVR